MFNPYIPGSMPPPQRVPTTKPDHGHGKPVDDIGIDGEDLILLGLLYVLLRKRDRDSPWPLIAVLLGFLILKGGDSADMLRGIMRMLPGGRK